MFCSIILQFTWGIFFWIIISRVIVTSRMIIEEQKINLNDDYRKLI